MLVSGVQQCDSSVCVCIYIYIYTSICICIYATQLLPLLHITGVLVLGAGWKRISKCEAEQEENGVY